jgi:hypothetical protein
MIKVAWFNLDGSDGRFKLIGLCWTRGRVPAHGVRWPIVASLMSASWVGMVPECDMLSTFRLPCAPCVRPRPAPLGWHAQGAPPR